MATLTITDIPDEVVQKLTAAAQSKGQTLEQEAREALSSHYSDRTEVLARIRARWAQLPPTSAAEVAAWHSR